MESIVYNIGRIKYLFTILFGKNRSVKKIIKETVDKNKVSKQLEMPGDYIITIGKKAVILTKYQNGRREPYIVKLWIKGGTTYEEKLHRTAIEYMDNEGYSWVYTIDDVGELMTYFKISDDKNNDTVFYHLELSQS